MEPRQVGDDRNAIADDLRDLVDGACARPPGAATARYHVQASDSPTVSCPCCSIPRISSCSCLSRHARAGLGIARRHQHREEAVRRRLPVSPFPLDDLARCRSLSMRIAPLKRRLSRVGTQSGSGASAATRFLSTASADLRGPGHLRGIGPQVHAEQHVADDHERQLASSRCRAPARWPDAATCSHRASISAVRRVTIGAKLAVCSRLKEGCTRRRCWRQVSPSAVSRLSPQYGLIRSKTHPLQ